jgi:hypothetical protein
VSTTLGSTARAATTITAHLFADLDDLPNEPRALPHERRSLLAMARLRVVRPTGGEPPEQPDYRVDRLRPC